MKGLTFPRGIFSFSPTPIRGVFFFFFVLEQLSGGHADGVVASPVRRFNVAGSGSVSQDTGSTISVVRVPCCRASAVRVALYCLQTLCARVAVVHVLSAWRPAV